MLVGGSAHAQQQQNCWFGVNCYPLPRPTAPIGGVADWHGMPQEQARDWIIQQSREFCRQYPTDPVCHDPSRSRRLPQ